jgi:hypothetical protein
MTAPVPLEDLFAQLETAVRKGDRDRARGRPCLLAADQMTR